MRDDIIDYQSKKFQYHACKNAIQKVILTDNKPEIFILLHNIKAPFCTSYVVLRTSYLSALQFARVFMVTSGNIRKVFLLTGC